MYARAVTLAVRTAPSGHRMLRKAETSAPGRSTSESVHSHSESPDPDHGEPGGPWTQAIDADNHYYEPLDAFTRHLDQKFRDRGVKPVHDGKRVALLIGGTVNRFIPNPTFDPIIVPGCLDPLFRGQIPEGVDPRSLMQVEPLRAEYRDRDPRLEVMDDQGLDAVLLFPTLGLRRRGGPQATTSTPPWPASPPSTRWLDEDWGFDHEGRIIGAPMLSLADPEAAVAELDRVLERGRPHRARPARAGPRPERHHPLARPPRSTTRSGPGWPRPRRPGRVPPGRQRLPRLRGHVGRRVEFLASAAPTRSTSSSCPTAPIQDTVASLIVHGVFDRFPDLRIASIENGSDWIALLVKRLKKQANQTPWVFDEAPLDTLRRTSG